MQKIFTVAYLKDLHKQLSNEEITYSRFVELLNEKSHKELLSEDLETCTGCEVRFVFEQGKDGMDDDTNYFCRSCYEILSKIMESDHLELKKKGEI